MTYTEEHFRRLEKAVRLMNNLYPKHGKEATPRTDALVKRGIIEDVEAVRILERERNALENELNRKWRRAWRYSAEKANMRRRISK